MSHMTGGFTETREADEEIQKICDRIKIHVEAKTGKAYREFKAISYRSQVVAGLNYLIKVYVGGEKYIHLSIFEALPCFGGELVLTAVEQDKTKDDPLIP